MPARKLDDGIRAGENFLPRMCRVSIARSNTFAPAVTAPSLAAKPAAKAAVFRRLEGDCSTTLGSSWAMRTQISSPRYTPRMPSPCSPCPERRSSPASRLSREMKRLLTAILVSVGDRSRHRWSMVRRSKIQSCTPTTAICRMSRRTGTPQRGLRRGSPIGYSKYAPRCGSDAAGWLLPPRHSQLHRQGHHRCDLFVAMAW
mmetsp:Transcript_21532/g.62359  ORF Transcript_21532/g.62359 Transcript_21532/m.62359 type:complete len:201 (+) Transcript_21532:686-1288(+)